MTVADLSVVLQHETEFRSFGGFLQKPDHKQKAMRIEGVTHEDQWDEKKKETGIFVENYHVLICRDETAVCESGDSCEDRKRLSVQALVLQHLVCTVNKGYVQPNQKRTHHMNYN